MEPTAAAAPPARRHRRTAAAIRRQKRRRARRRVEADITARFYSLVIWIRNDADRSLEHLGINAAHYVALRYVVSSRYGSTLSFGVGPKDVAEHLSVSRGYATKIIQHLEKLGLVTSERDFVFSATTGRRSGGNGKVLQPTRAGLFCFVRAREALDWRAPFFFQRRDKIRNLHDTLGEIHFHRGDTPTKRHPQFARL